MRKILFLICLLISSNIVNAADWVEIEYKTYADLKSYKNDGIYASAWFKDLNPGDWELINGKKIWFNQYYYKANCTNKTINLLYAVSYDLKGKVVNSANYPDIKSYYDPVVPDTRGETKYNALCN